MAMPFHDTLQATLLEDWQRGLPLVPRPFEAIAERAGTTETRVIKELALLRASGAISRVGGVVRPNTLGASTLAAVAVPEFQTAELAALIATEPGVNHVYLRENDLNIWFVATGPDRDYVDGVLKRIAHRTGLDVLDLRLEQSYHIDLGFALDGSDAREQAAFAHKSHDPSVPQHSVMAPARPAASTFAPEAGDPELVQALTDGLDLVPRPFLAAAAKLGRTEDDVIARIARLVDADVVPRVGVIVRHRALGWRSNAMVVWDVPHGDVDRAGLALAASPGINLCYRRTRYPEVWPYNLYCMVHARSRDEALSTLARASSAAGLDGVRRQILFSLRCFKQTGALVAAPKEAA